MFFVFLCVLQALGRNNLQNPVVSLFSDIRVNPFEFFFFFYESDPKLHEVLMF